MPENGWKWLEIALNCWKWLQFVGNGWKWPEWLEMAGNEWKWMEIDGMTDTTSQLYNWFKSYGVFTEWVDLPIGEVASEWVCACGLRSRLIRFTSH